MSELRVRRREPSDEGEVEAFLDERSALRVARLGRLEHPLEHPGLVRGTGSALIEAVERLAADAGCSRLRVKSRRRGRESRTGEA